MNLLAMALWVVLWLGLRRMMRARDWFDIFIATELLAAALLSALILWLPPLAASAWWMLFVLLLTVVESLVLMAFMVRARHGEGPTTPGIDADQLLHELEHKPQECGIKGEFDG